MRAAESDAHAPLMLTFQTRKAPTPAGTRHWTTVLATVTAQDDATSSLPVAPNVAVTIVDASVLPSRASRAAVLPKPVPKSSTLTKPCGLTKMSLPASVAL